MYRCGGSRTPLLHAPISATNPCTVSCGMPHMRPASTDSSYEPTSVRAAAGALRPYPANEPVRSWLAPAATTCWPAHWAPATSGSDAAGEPTPSSSGCHAPPSQLAPDARRAPCAQTSGPAQARIGAGSRLASAASSPSPSAASSASSVARRRAGRGLGCAIAMGRLCRGPSACRGTRMPSAQPCRSTPASCSRPACVTCVPPADGALGTCIGGGWAAAGSTSSAPGSATVHHRNACRAPSTLLLDASTPRAATGSCRIAVPATR